MLIEPYVRGIYGMVTTISQGNIVIMSIMLGMVALFPITFFVYGSARCGSWTPTWAAATWTPASGSRAPRAR